MTAKLPMTRRYLNKLLVFLLAGLSSGTLRAQTFHWESAVSDVPSDAYYKILLTPPVTSKLNDSFSDLRVYDGQNEEVPYQLYKDATKRLPDRFITYPLVAKKYSTGCCSYIEVKNTLSDAIDHIVLEVNNADASRQMTLSGSYDGEAWFAVKDHYTVETFNGIEKGEKKTTTLIRFDFPLTDYKYYRFDFDDWDSWWHDYRYPIFVVRAGYVEPAFIPEEVIALPQPQVQQKDSAKVKESYVRITFPEPQYIGHIHVTADQKKDYYRAATLYEVSAPGEPYSERKLAATILSSRNTNEISLYNLRCQYLLLKVRNEDDKPLKITGVESFQVMHYLVSELKKGETYHLRYGAGDVPAPVYDMQYFPDNIPDSMTVLQPSGRTEISMKLEEKIAKQDAEEETKTVFTHRGYIWAAIVIVILLLGVLSFRMLRGMGEK